MLTAINELRELRRKRLHEEEKNIAYLAFQTAEMNRDRKKQKKPFELQDFYFYPDDEENDSVDAIYGATAKAMTEKKVFPSWALFAYKDIIKNADKSTPPEELYYIKVK